MQISNSRMWKKKKEENENQRKWKEQCVPFQGNYPILGNHGLFRVSGGDIFRVKPLSNEYILNKVYGIFHSFTQLPKQYYMIRELHQQRE